MEPTSPAWQADSLPLSHLGSLHVTDFIAKGVMEPTMPPTGLSGPSLLPHPKPLGHITEPQAGLPVEVTVFFFIRTLFSLVGEMLQAKDQYSSETWKIGRAHV